MAEFIFDLQRFENGGSGSGGGSNSGGSNAKTDSDTSAKAADVWSDGWKYYSAAQISEFTSAAYALAALVAPNEYVATEVADTFNLSTLNNNIVYNVDRFDNLNFVDSNLEGFADLNFGNGYVDLVFDKGTFTRIYTLDSTFTPRLNFASGLNEIYSYDLGYWFSAEDLTTSTAFWNTDFWNNYVSYMSTEGAYESIPVSSSVNSLVTAGVEDEVVFYDTAFPNVVSRVGTSSNGTTSEVYRFTEDGQVNRINANALNFTFINGTNALVYYQDTFSPTIRFASGESMVYNSATGTWRTPEEAAADALQMANDEAIAELNKEIFESHFNVVYDRNATDAQGNRLYTSNTAFPVSRGAATLFYNLTSTNDLYFNDAFSTNVVDYGDDGTYLNLIFDTGAVSMIGYTSIVSPIMHFADGKNYAFNWGTQELCNAYSGTYELSSDGYRVDTTPNAFNISRLDNSFINKVGSKDDIYLYDTTMANVLDLTAAPYYISITFDTGENLRVQDDYMISPTFHFADGTVAAYNWYSSQWAGTFDTNADFADNLALSSTTNNFVRDAEGRDAIYLVDAYVWDVTSTNTSSYYVNLNFDTGASTAVSYTTMATPDFVFADGSRYYYQLTENEATGGYDGKWMTYDANGYAVSADLAESADLWGDVAPADDLLTDGTVAADATLSDLVAPVAYVTSFDAGNAFDMQSAGEFVLATPSTDPSQKSA